jgi:hypothetical protein
MKTKTVTRFAIKNKDGKYLGPYTNLEKWVDIWDAELFDTKPIWMSDGKIVQISVTYKEYPYEVPEEN